MGQKLTNRNTSTPQIHRMCILHRRTTLLPQPAVSYRRQLLPDDGKTYCLKTLSLLVLQLDSQGGQKNLQCRKPEWGQDKYQQLPTKLLYYNLMIKSLIIQQTELTNPAFFNFF